ncbi:TIGR02679 family protein [Salicibibacter halophilus]|uniref:TIGR02679 family protein n=1 Tax=Salicibibacter halophilus TaxID=2502791 RepID=A0A514LG53_9BACI|nr:TIGR02679 family protein [Salicibibacter halophilus]QDI90842.1 TIGR02679 family protein [Salicibibacter halophilus]
MLNEALRYFREKSGFGRLFPLFRKKIESLGRVGGTVTIMGFNDTEVEEIALFFGVSKAKLLEKGKVSLPDFEKKLEKTRFAGIGARELLEAYFGEKIISKREQQAQKREAEEQALVYWKNQYPGLDFWLDYVQERHPDTYWIYRLLESEQLAAMMPVLHEAVQSLPDEPLRLPVFSQKISGDPHAFDLHHDLGKLFIHFLQVKRSGQGMATGGSEDITALLESFYILRDDITNDVTVANLLAENEVGSIHPLWQAAATYHSVLNIPLRELQHVSAVRPASSKRVWIVENSGVYSSLLDAVLDAPLICTHGQFKLAALRLMDKLVEEGVSLYYAGDIDPEGITMANRLLERYPRHVHFWRMDVASYRQSLSANRLDEERLAKLANMGHEALQPVVAEMKATKKAGYQEGLLPVLVDDLKKHRKIK